MTLLLGKTQWTLIDLFTITSDMKVASALFSLNNSTSQWWKPSPWQNHSRKSIFNNWILPIIAARTEIAGSLSSACGAGTSCSCLTGSFGAKENPNCDDMRLVRLLTLFSTVIFFCWKRVHTPFMVMTISVLKRISRFISVWSAA